MAYKTAIRRADRIENLILTIRAQRVMLDSDLAMIYGVTTKRLNEQFKRNRARFPIDFAFQLTAGEANGMRSQIATASKRNTRYRPWVFTKHGAIMMASVLNSPIAVEASVRVVRAFVYLREQLVANKELAAKLAELEGRVGQHDGAIKHLFEAIRRLLATPTLPEPPPRREVGFHVKEQAARYRTRRSFSKN